MVYEATSSKLIEMRLTNMAEMFRIQQQEERFKAMSFEERFGMLVDSEWSRRKNNHLQKLIRQAGFTDSSACIEDIEYHSDRKLDKDLLNKLSTGNYIQEHHNVIILGAAGAGKSYIGCALGNAACRIRYTVRFIRLPELLTDLASARIEGTFKKFITQYKKISLLILDEWLLCDLHDIEARDLLEIIEARHKRASTIFISQFAPKGWHGKIGEGTLADAILDRIVHDSYTLFINGEDSMRKRKGIQKNS